MGVEPTIFRDFKSNLYIAVAGLLFYINIHSSSEYFFISSFLDGKLKVIHYFIIALSVKLNILPISVKGFVLINFFNSSLVIGVSLILNLLAHSIHLVL